MPSERQSRIKKWFLRLKDSGKTKDFLVFLIFVAIAAVFWVVTALNDDVQGSYDVRLAVDNVPDSVTFITLPPAKVRVTVRDRGVNLLRRRIGAAPDLHLNFEEFADGNRFRLSHAALAASMKHLFGSTATISSINVDSLNLKFTRLPGKRLPIDLVYDVTVAPGMVLADNPKLSGSAADVFSTEKNDTLRFLKTEKVVLRNIDRNTTVEVPVVASPGTRVIPATVEVTFTVEPLVKKESEVTVTADNLPLGMDILFFPSRVKVAYYVPMSRYNQDNSQVPITVEASFNEAVHTSSDKVGVKVTSKAPYMSNVELLTDSVEYTLVRAQ